MKILITGGLGFIGSTLALSLCKNNDVYLYDIRDNNKGIKIYENNPVTFIQGDICDKNKIKKLLDNSFDCIIHLCAISRVVVAEQNPEECVRVNLNGVTTLLNELENSNSKNAILLFGSSREVYGSQSNLPVKENAELMPVNIYGQTKLKGEELFKEYSLKHNNPCGILRFSNVYGNEYDLLGRVIPRFIYGIYNNQEIYIEGGEQVIDFTHIDDTVWGIISAINYFKNNNIYETFHILPGKPNTLYDIITILEDYFNKKANVKVNNKRNYDVEKFIGNPEKINKYFGSHMFYNLKEGLELSIKNYLKVIEYASEK